MQKSLQTPLLIIFILLIFLLPVHAETHDLQLDLKKGDMFIINSLVTKKSKETISTGIIDYTAKLTTTYKITVTELTDQTVTFSFNYLTLSIDSNMFFLDSKSQTLDINGVADLEEFITDKGFTMVMYRCGEVKEFIGLDQFAEELYNHLAQSEQQEEQDVAKMLKDLYKPKAMKNRWNTYINYIPTIPEPVGETWENDIQLTNPIFMDGIATYNLTETTNNLLSANITSELTGEEDIYDEMFGGETTVKMDTKINGKVTIYNDTRWFQSIRIMQYQNGSYEMPFIQDLSFIRDAEVSIESQLIATPVYSI